MSTSLTLKKDTHDRRYFETGSALFVFIWSKNFWKSKPPSFGLETGDPGPLPGWFAGAFPVSGRASCCDANVDKVEGEGTAFADASSDCGRGRSGNAKLLARELKEGNGDDEDVGTVAAAADPDGLGGVVLSFAGGSGGGEGVCGGGGWPSDDSQASFAAFSS